MSTEFQGRVKAFYDFTGGKQQATSAFDDYGHGTHVAGTIAGSGALSANKAYRSLAPNVQLVVLKVLDASGAGYTSDVVRAIDFAVANKSKFAIDVINLSLGHPIYEPASTDPLVQAVERASKAGIIVVAAAGNSGLNPTTGQPGYAGINSPGNAPSAITMGAVSTSNTVTRRDDRIPDYSSSGPTWYDALAKPDLLAPGHRIIAVGAKRSTIYKDYPNLRATDSDYIRLSGTSMATAVGSGVVALMIENHRAAHPYTPAMTPNAVKAMLQVLGRLRAQRPRHRVRPAARRRRCAQRLGSRRARARGGHDWQGGQLLAAAAAGAVDDDRRRERLVVAGGDLGQRRHLGQRHAAHEPDGVGHRGHLGLGHQMGQRHRGRLGQQRRLDRSLSRGAPRSSGVRVLLARPTAPRSAGAAPAA